MPNADRSSARLLSSLAISDVADSRSAAVSESRFAMNGGNETTIERSVRSFSCATSVCLCPTPGFLAMRWHASSAGFIGLLTRTNAAINPS